MDEFEGTTEFYDYTMAYLDEDDDCYFNFTDYDDSEPRSWNCFYWSELLPPLAVYTLSLLLGVTGNILIVFTTCRYRRMKSPTNVFLASLATADLLLIIICIPVKLAKLFSYTWTMGFFLCKMVHYLQTVVAVCSVLTLMAISIERYYAICHPMKAKYICTISQAKKIIITIWITSFLLALPNLVVQVHLEVGFKLKAFYCSLNYDDRPQLQLYVMYMLILVFIVPSSVMVVTYSTICWEVWRVMKQRHHMVSGRAVLKPESIPLANKHQNGNQNGTPATSLPPPNDDKGNVKQVIKMLILIVVVFITCWAPILIWDTLTAFHTIPEYATGTLKHLKTTFHLMSYANSCINPIIYGFMSKNFRESFQKALSRCCGRSLQRQLSLSQTRGTSIRKDRSTVSTQFTS
ncbi:QRFP-like peptide receptor [Macrosteles quadrilineatus]|uniref:QRFP-like peptide receptor n=1 Tax=Macrosteles quadrilineatus TaxID=74068 RepID=UPI0023E1DA2C|nr:QRFP-like peptide receptor [Macrosteles quadrilineatus]